MRVLIVGRYKKQYDNLMPFVTEQGTSIAALGNDVDYYVIKGNGFLSYFKAVKGLKKKIDEFKPDIIHAHYGLSGITAVLQNKVPVVTTFHNGETLSFVANFLSSIFSLRAKYVIYVAQHIYNKAFLKKKNNFSIIPCGVNLEECTITPFGKAREILNFDKNKKYILFGGGFDNLRKNFALLNDALVLYTGKQGVKKDVDVQYDGQTVHISSFDYGNVEAIEMKKLSRKQCVLIMCGCDAFSLPSKSEGSPQALKEAMVCNCPIFATDIADVKYLLGEIPGHYICSFEPQNVMEQVQKALTFNSRTEGRKRIVELGLSNEQVAEKIINIYLQL